MLAMDGYWIPYAETLVHFWNGAPSDLMLTQNKGGDQVNVTPRWKLILPCLVLPRYGYFNERSVIFMYQGTSFITQSRKQGEVLAQSNCVT